MDLYWCVQNALQHEALCLLSPLLRFICWFLMNVCATLVHIYCSKCFYNPSTYLIIKCVSNVFYKHRIIAAREKQIL